MKKLWLVTSTRTAKVNANNEEEATNWRDLSYLDQYGWDTEDVTAERLPDEVERFVDDGNPTPSLS